MRARPLGGSPAPSHRLGVMPLSSAACRAGGGQGLPASPQTAWRSAAPRWQGPSAAVCSSGMPGAFQTPEGTAKPSPPAPAAHAEHAGGRPGSLSGPRSKPYDRQTDRSPSGAGLHCQCPRSPVPGSSPAGRAAGSLPARSRPVSPLPWLHELRRESRGSHRPPGTRGRQAEGTQHHCRILLTPARTRQRWQPRGSVMAAGLGTGLVSILPSCASGGSREKTFVLTHARLPSCVRRFDGRGGNLDRFLCQRERRIQEPQSMREPKTGNMKQESPKDFR